MNHSKNIFVARIFLVFVSLIIAASIVFLIKNYSKNWSFAKPEGILITTNNEKLQENINLFMELQEKEHDMGEDEYHCSNILYGYDNKYAYALVQCSGFTFKNKGELEYKSGFSVPTRLEFRQPDYKIVAYKQPSDGSYYNPTFKKLFPKEIYDIDRLSKKDLERLRQEVISKITFFTKDKAIAQVKEKQPELKEYLLDSSPLYSIISEQAQNGWYIMFAKSNSGTNISSAHCFRVTDSKEVSVIGAYSYNSMSSSIATNETLSPETCKLRPSITVDGIIVCLPCKHEECILGFHGSDDNKYYGIKNLNQQNFTDDRLSRGQKVTITGILSSEMISECDGNIVVGSINVISAIKN